MLRVSGPLLVLVCITMCNDCVCAEAPETSAYCIVSFHQFKRTLEASSCCSPPRRLVLSQDEMTSFFMPSLETVAARAIQMLSRAGGADVIVLVGGFSSSRFAMRTLRAALEVPGRPVVTPIYSKSAVLEGRCAHLMSPVCCCSSTCDKACLAGSFSETLAPVDKCLAGPKMCSVRL